MNKKSIFKKFEDADEKFGEWIDRNAMSGTISDAGKTTGEYDSGKVSLRKVLVADVVAGGNIVLTARDIADGAVIAKVAGKGSVLFLRRVVALHESRQLKTAIVRKFVRTAGRSVEAVHKTGQVIRRVNQLRKSGELKAIVVNGIAKVNKKYTYEKIRKGFKDAHQKTLKEDIVRLTKQGKIRAAEKKSAELAASKEKLSENYYYKKYHELYTPEAKKRVKTAISLLRKIGDNELADSLEADLKANRYTKPIKKHIKKTFEDLIKDGHEDLVNQLSADVRHKRLAADVIKEEKRQIQELRNEGRTAEANEREAQLERYTNPHEYHHFVIAKKNEKVWNVIKNQRKFLRKVTPETHAKIDPFQAVYDKFGRRIEAFPRPLRDLIAVPPSYYLSAARIAKDLIAGDHDYQAWQQQQQQEKQGKKSPTPTVPKVQFQHVSGAPFDMSAMKEGQYLVIAKKEFLAFKQEVMDAVMEELTNEMIHTFRPSNAF